MPSLIWNVPNLLSLSRLPLAVGVFVCVSYDQWTAGLLVFTCAALTDWADGWWARRYGPLTAVGRALDPLTDKVLMCGSFVYLLPVPGTGLMPWMVTAIVCREVAVTGVRGMVEATGVPFPADGFGKLKTALQCVAIGAVLAVQALAAAESPAVAWARPVQVVLLWGTVVATLGSGLRYLVRAIRVLSPG